MDALSGLTVFVFGRWSDCMSRKQCICDQGKVAQETIKEYAGMVEEIIIRVESGDNVYSYVSMSCFLRHLTQYELPPRS